MGSGECCGTHIIKGVLYAYQFVFLLTGIAIGAVGIWTYLTTYHYVNVVENTTYQAAIYLFLVTGGLVIITCLIGFCAISKNKTKVLFCYILLLVLVFLLESLVAILSYVYQQNIEDEIDRNLNSTFLQTYKQFDDKTESIDFIQQSLQCCGAEKVADWSYSIWLFNKTGAINKVPDSCCKSYSYLCGKRDHPSNIYYAGCSDRLAPTIRFNLWIVCATCLGISLLQVIGVVFGIKLFLRLEAEDRNYSPNVNSNEALIN